MEKTIPFTPGFFSQHNIFSTIVSRQKIIRFLWPLFFIVLLLAFAGKGWAQDVTFNNGTGATWTVPAGVTCISVKCWGAGGGGGGSSSNNNGGSGGGGGGYSEIFISVTPGWNFTYTVGTGGTAGAAGGGNGGLGGSTTFSGNSYSLQAGGGTGGAGNMGAIGTGGTASGGTTNTTGGDGTVGGGSGGNGGNSPNGGTGGAGNTNAIGSPGNIPGGGGGGGERSGGTSMAGGAGARGEITITYFYSPTITSFSPANACSGSGATVTITGTNFTGTTSVSFNGTSAAYTVNSSTEIAATLPAGATTGTISVTTPCGTVASASSFTVNSSPAAVSVATAGTYCTSTTLTADNGSDGTIYYQSTTSGGTSTATPSASEVVSATGTYYFRAQSAGGCWGAQGSAAVTILTTASINTHPANQSYCVGGTANFSVVASGSSLSYQWQYWDGGSWVSVANGTPAGAIYTNATTATMTVAGITASGTYDYRCYVSNTCSNATSNSATLTVSSAAPTISGTTTVCATYTTTLTASITPGTWSSDNTGIATVDAGGVVTGVAAGTATITYTVTATGCTATASVTVTSACPPANDDCANATSLPCGTTNLAGTTVNSVSETPGVGCGMSKFGVWYTFAGNDMGTTISVTTTALDIEMAVVSGSCGSLTNIECVDLVTTNATETYTFSTITGTTYYVYIGYYKVGTPTGTFTISRSTCDALCTSPTVSVADATDTNSVTMTANASGGSGGTIAYKWYTGTDCSGAAIAGATNSTYSATVSGNYSCKAYITGFEGSCFSCEYGYATVIVDCTPPANQPTAPTYTNNTTGTSVTVNWTGTAGYNYLVVARLTSTTDVAPINGAVYTANTAFGAGTGTATTGTGNFVVYKGTLNSVAVTGLNGSTSYTFTVYAFGVGPPTCYKTPGASSSVTTVSYYTHPTTGLFQSSVGSCMTLINSPTSYYDDGGPAGNYSLNITYGGGIYRVFCPGSANQAIQATFVTMDIEATDRLTIVNGASASTALPVLWAGRGDYPPSGSVSTTSGSWTTTFTSTDASGCLSFRFNSDAAGVGAGWNITLSSVASANWQTPVNSDCQTAIAVCDLLSISATSNGPGLQTNCAGGCIGSEFYTSWYVWQVTSNGSLGFTIDPNGSDDYDFSLYKTSSCSNMGAPIRCSFATSVLNTGLAAAETDIYEDANGAGINGWVDTVNAKAGEFYYLMISDYTKSGSGFQLSFTGTCKIECEIPPLPIDLLTFDAKCANNYVGLNWSTATETNNDYFTIERSADASDWESVKNITGAGNSNSVLSYSAFDKNPIKGTSYYRLKQTDYDGHFGYSAPVVVSCTSDDGPLIRYYPNPITGVVTVDIQNLIFEKASVAIFDVLGNMVYHKNISNDELLDKTLSINLSNLSSGIYMVSFTSEEFTETGRIIKK